MGNSFMASAEVGGAFLALLAIPYAAEVFKLDDVRRFEAEGKPLWAPTGDNTYDDLEGLSDLMMLEMFFFALADPRLWQDANAVRNQVRDWYRTNQVNRFIKIWK